MELLRIENFDEENFTVEKLYYDTCIVTNRRPKLSPEELKRRKDRAGEVFLRAWRKGSMIIHDA